MRNLNFLLIAFFLFALVIPVKAMPCVSVQKTERSIYKQFDVKTVIVMVNVENVAINSLSRTNATRVDSSAILKNRFVKHFDKRNYPLVNIQCLKKNLNYSFLLETLPDKNC